MPRRDQNTASRGQPRLRDQRRDHKELMEEQPRSGGRRDEPLTELPQKRSKGPVWRSIEEQRKSERARHPDGQKVPRAHSILIVG